LLTHKLIEPIAGHDAVTLGVDIDAMVDAWSMAIEGYAEADRLTIAGRP
jgi:hypothetical protein